MIFFLLVIKQVHQPNAVHGGNSWLPMDFDIYPNHHINYVLICNKLLNLTNGTDGSKHLKSSKLCFFESVIDG